MNPSMRPEPHLSREESSPTSGAGTRRRRSRIGSREALSFLSEAGHTLASTLDYHSTLQALTELAVPRVACFCVVDVLEADGRLRRLGVAHVDPDRLPLLQETSASPRAPTPRSQLERMLSETEPVLVSPFSEESLEGIPASGEDRELLRSLAPTSLMLVPLVARGNRLGVLLLASTRTDRHYQLDDLLLAGELGRVASISIDNARLYREAQEAIRAREEVLHVVSHDLRNPIGTVLMGASFLLDDAPRDLIEGPFGRTLRSMRNAVESAERMISDLLDVTRIETGRLGIEPQVEAIAPLLEEAVERHRHFAAERGIELQYRASDGLPLVLADRHRVLQILGNLVGNALKFTPEGGRVVLGVTAHDEGVLCEVDDTGPGIPPDQLPHVFDRFWQAGRSDRRGLGLGLAIVHGLVEAHGGRVWVESEPGRGTRFRFTLPPAQSAEPAP